MNYEQLLEEHCQCDIFLWTLYRVINKINIKTEHKNVYRSCNTLYDIKGIYATIISNKPDIPHLNTNIGTL